MDLEGVKLDVVINQSKLSNSISINQKDTSHNTEAINQLRDQLSNMQSRIVALEAKLDNPLPKKLTTNENSPENNESKTASPPTQPPLNQLNNIEISIIKPLALDENTNQSRVNLQITWHSKSGAIIFDGVKAGNLVKRIKDILSKPDDAVKTINSDLNMEANTDRSSSRIIENEVSSHNSTCSVVIEGIKVEMVILETRLRNTIKENKSDICSLKFKVKDLEGVIRHQDDAILKLSEDNLILKSKLSSFENLTYKVICHDHVNNERAYESASTTQVNDQCGFHDKDQLTNLNANNSRFIETSTKENPSLPNSTQVPDPHEKQRLTIDLTTQRKERINIMTNVVNDQCGSQDKDQPTNLSINNPSFNEISTNENRSLFNSTQVPVSHDNQRVTIDLTTKPKEGVNIIYNPQPDNENNLGNNRHPRAKHNTPCPFLRRRGWCAKGNRCDFKHPHEEQKHLVPCPFLKKRRFCLKGTRCDFSHSATFPHSIQPIRPIKNYPTPPIFYDNRQPMVPQQRKHWSGYNQSVQWHPNGPGFFQSPPKPLMETPLCPPYTFQVPPYCRARYAETLV